MTIVNNTTGARGYQLPHPSNNMSDDVVRLIAALNGIDADVAAILVSLAGKSALGHTHPIADVIGLQAALDGKSATSHNHTFASLSDVDISSVSTGMLIMRQSNGKWGAAFLSASDITSGQFDPARMPSYISTASITSITNTIAANKATATQEAIAFAIALG